MESRGFAVRIANKSGSAHFQAGNVRPDKVLRVPALLTAAWCPQNKSRWFVHGFPRGVFAVGEEMHLYPPLTITALPDVQDVTCDHGLCCPT